MIFSLALSAAAWAKPAKEEISRQYQRARSEYQELSSGKSKSRKSWLAVAAALENIAKAAPKHEAAPKSLFLIGRIFQEIPGAKKSGDDDLAQAINAYEDLSSGYPDSNLADDALFALGGIYRSEKNDPDKAARYYARVIALYPGGDMAARAEEELKRLKKTGGTKAKRGKAANGEKCLVPPAMNDTENKEPAPAEGARRSEPATVMPVRHWSGRRYTRLVVETSAPVSFKHQMLAGDGKAARRIYLDLENSRLTPAGSGRVPIGDGLLAQARAAQFDPKTVRVVLDTQADISDYKVFALTDPARVVVDVFSSEEAGRAGDQPTIKGKPAREQAAKIKPAVPASKIIVLDPGHGGKDPGTCGPNGLKEKEIVLDVAKRAAKILREKTGHKVVLTRTRDVFIPLEERTAVANALDADLFVSVHVNAAPNREARGVETYVLDSASNKEAMRLAAMENASSARQANALQAILLDLLRNYKMSESLKLAGTVQDGLVDGVGRKFSEINNLGVKKAPFVVLIGARMPAILTEIAFMSNEEEAKRLASDSYREEVAAKLAESVARYLEGH